MRAHQQRLGTTADTLEAAIGLLLRRQRATLALAESCTGGLVTDRLTDVPGSSRYVRGTIVVYHNALKRALGVPSRLLTRSGAVSAPVAKAMARAIRVFAGADIGLAITGIAGPTGGSKQKPVGLIYLGLATARQVRSRRLQLAGDRRAIKVQAAQRALEWLRHILCSRR